MILDIAALIIVLSAMFQGFKNGFLYTFFRTFGWIISLIAAFLLKPFVIPFLDRHTSLYTGLSTHMQGIFSDNSSENVSDYSTYLPAALREPLINKLKFTGEDAVGLMLEKSTDILYHLLVLLAITFILKTITNLILAIFSKKRSFGIYTGIDGFFGLLTGSIQGIILLFVALAILIPINGLLNWPILSDLIQQSKVVKILYENNVVTLFLKKI